MNVLRSKFIFRVILVVFVFVFLGLTCHYRLPHVNITAYPDSIPSGSTVSLLIEVDDGDFPEDTVTCTLSCPRGVFSDTMVVFYYKNSESVSGTQWGQPSKIETTSCWGLLTSSKSSTSHSA